MLLEELDARGLGLSPRAIEMMLDRIQATSVAARTELRVDAVESLVSAGRGIFAAVKNRGQQAITPLMAVPPNNAAYQVATNRREWHSVILDMDTEPFLERVSDSCPKQIDGSVKIDVWLGETPDGIAVHIGTQRVGHLDSATTDQYLPHMASASVLGLNAVVPARLTHRRREPNYLLEIEVPNRD